MSTSKGGSADRSADAPRSSPATARRTTQRNRTFGNIAFSMRAQGHPDGGWQRSRHGRRSDRRATWPDGFNPQPSSRDPGERTAIIPPRGFAQEPGLGLPDQAVELLGRRGGFQEYALLPQELQGV